MTDDQRSTLTKLCLTAQRSILELRQLLDHCCETDTTDLTEMFHKLNELLEKLK